MGGCRRYWTRPWVRRTVCISYGNKTSIQLAYILQVPRTLQSHKCPPRHTTSTQRDGEPKETYMLEKTTNSKPCPPPTCFCTYHAPPSPNVQLSPQRNVGALTQIGSRRFSFFLSPVRRRASNRSNWFHATYSSASA